MPISSNTKIYLNSVKETYLESPSCLQLTNHAFFLRVVQIKEILCKKIRSNAFDQKCLITFNIPVQVDNL